ncbi:MAG: superoxide dismutase, Ni [Methanobacteriota archaeon]|nr:MAG: superoxide dismutase, Ni [Euryarchaeota archaeon]
MITLLRISCRFPGAPRAPATRLNNGIRYEATMSLLYSLARLLDRISPAPIAYAHCDIPCGIYDPHHSQLAAHTVVRMNDLINQLEKPGTSATPEQRQEYTNKLARYLATKEQHAEMAKNEIRILWGDYFKPEHLKTFPELHDLVWKALKTASKARQEINLQAAEDLLKATNDIASIFWKTKGFETITAKAPHPTERQTVYPKYK